MAFLSFLGRLLFVSVFVLSAYQEFNEFGVDAYHGPNWISSAICRSKRFFPSFYLNTHAHACAIISMKHLILGAIIMKALGSLLFVFGSSFGALILLLHQAISALILYDFYNYDADKKEFAQLFAKFTQSLALLGALLFFIGMKNSMPRRSSKKKATKAKAN
ncbi:hypothetical protein CDL12_10949 [Handroanthus impetiginosus]|uniref:Uncharacterized protein n=1 Tax=Handroanthus impetiginosus TaxID=429701 RepID=A0A2G9HFU8_9LAMI|nr:hypothetical protein CDL12_10949 [Handroanthus impetiginosus]